MGLKIVNKIFGLLGYIPKPKSDSNTVDIHNDKSFMELYQICRPYTMTSMERLYALYNSVNYVVDNGIEGDFVECGVWRGGSSMIMALTLLKRGDTSRNIHLYDTFEGMSDPTEIDKSFSGDSAQSLLDSRAKTSEDTIWCFSSLDEVKRTLLSTQYDPLKLHFIKGKVEDTLTQQFPTRIAILRLDTDWYESTKMELEVLYPKLSGDGVLIIDDFGHWEGAKKAVIEYFKKQETQPILHRIDYTGRIMIKK